MQYKCMEREMRTLSMEGFYFPSVMYIAIIPAEMQLCQKEIKNPCIQAPDFPLPLPGAGEAKRILQIRKKYDNPSQKPGFHPLQHEPAFPDDKSRVDAGFSCDLALPPDSERPAILTGSDTIRVFVLFLAARKKQPLMELLFSL